MPKKDSRAHVLSELKNDKIPRYMIFVDTETTQEPAPGDIVYQDLMLGVGIFWEYRKGRKNEKIEIFRFRKAQLFWEFVYSHCIKGTQLCVFAHNAVFDMVVLEHIKWLEFFGYECEFVFDNAMTFIAQWRSDDHTILILNTANWFHGSVARWGAELGLDKLEMPDYDMSQEEWFVYCERDTMILKELVEWYIKFLQDNDLGPWKYTIASQAFAAFRHRFMVNKIYIPDNKVEERLAREAYHGGRTEVFRQGTYIDGPYYKIDVNSMYPYVMKEFKYPSALARVGKELTYEQASYIRDKFGIIADCTICTPIPYFVDTSSGRNTYPIGTFRTMLTTEEFYLAFDNRWIQEVHEYALYRMRPIFKQYIDFFYGLKVKCTEQGWGLQRAFTKLYLNSLYGKFGQRGYKDEEIGRVAVPGLGVWFSIDATTHETYQYRLIGHSLLRYWQEGEAWNSFCAIAAHVTANARLYLYNTIMRIGREHAYYSDTDSIIIDREGYKVIRDDLHDTRLGAWALEGQSDKVEVLAPKHYWFHDHWTRKGVRKSAEVVGEQSFRQETWPGFNTILKSGKERYFNTFMVKTLSPDIETGIVMPDGRVSPLAMGDESEESVWYNVV